MTKRQLAYMKTLPASAQGGYKKAMTTNSLAAAVKAMCRDCNGYEQGAKRTRECHIEECPLWPHRR